MILKLHKKIIQQQFIQTLMNKQNQITKTTFTKTDVTGDQEVSGAKMSITD